MNKIKNFIVRHPYAFSILLPTLASIIHIVFSINYPSWSLRGLMISFYYPYIALLGILWVFVCIIIFKGRRLILTIFWILYSSIVIGLYLIVPWHHMQAYTPNKEDEVYMFQQSNYNHKYAYDFIQNGFDKCLDNQKPDWRVSCDTSIEGHVNKIIEHLGHHSINQPYQNNPDSLSGAYIINSSDNNPPRGKMHIFCSVNTCNIYTNNGKEILSDTVTKD